MIPQSNGIIYLSERRGLTQQGTDYRSYRTFASELYRRYHNRAPGSLQFINDDTLSGRQQTTTLVKKGCSLLLLPVVGRLNYRSQHPEGEPKRISGSVEAGQISRITPNRDTLLTLSNPYPSDPINFLQIGIQGAVERRNSWVGSFNLSAGRNTLQPLYFEEGCDHFSVGSIGQFGERTSQHYKVENPDSGVFAFVIDGVFEVQDRLLQARDGLALWEVADVEFEALTPEAVLLVLELCSHPEAAYSARW